MNLTKLSNEELAVSLRVVADVTSISSAFARLLDEVARRLNPEDLEQHRDEVRKKYEQRGKIQAIKELRERAVHYQCEDGSLGLSLKDAKEQVERWASADGWVSPHRGM